MLIDLPIDKYLGRVCPYAVAANALVARYKFIDFFDTTSVFNQLRCNNADCHFAGDTGFAIGFEPEILKANRCPRR